MSLLLLLVLTNKGNQLMFKGQGLYSKFQRHEACTVAYVGMHLTAYIVYTNTCYACLYNSKCTGVSSVCEFLEQGRAIWGHCRFRVL